MRFTITYHDKMGALKEECVEAASRGDCLARMKARGISPISMTVGASAKAGARKAVTGRRSRISIGPMVVALLVVVVGGGVWWLWNSRSEDTMRDVKVKPKSTALAKEVKPSAAPKPVPEAPKPVVTNVAEPKLSAPKLTHEERIEMLEKKILENPPNMSVRSNRVFSTGLEQSLAAIFSTPLGAPPPLIPTRLSPVTLVHLEKILDTPNEILETDSEKAVEAKMACAAAKKEMKAYVDGGGDPEKFLEHYHSILRQANAEWKAAQFTLIETMKTDPGLAPTMEAEVNENFKARGMRPIKMPPGLKERYGIK